VDDKVVYGESYGSKLFFCPKCRARVGTHDHNHRPYGILANAEVRRWRGVVHKAFDPLYKKGDFSRSGLYSYVFGELGWPEHKHHMAMLDVDDLKRVLAWLMVHGPKLS
jgi:hypothetical protein